MLKKLIKYEWKSTCKVGLLMLAGIVLASLFGVLSFQAPMWKEMMGAQAQMDSMVQTVFNVMSVLVLVFYIIMLVGLSYGIVIYLGVHFYRSMYTDEGYLAHTLPVTSHQLFISKIAVGGIWVLIITAAIVLSSFGLVFCVLSPVVEMEMGWEMFFSELSDVMRIFEEELGISLMQYVITLVVSVVISAFTGIITLFCSVTIGQLFNRHRGMMAIVSYIIVVIINQIIAFIAEIPFDAIVVKDIYGTEMATSINISLMPKIYVALLVSILTSVIIYFVAHHIDSKKLNME